MRCCCTMDSLRFCPHLASAICPSAICPSLLNFRKQMWKPRTIYLQIASYQPKPFMIQPRSNVSLLMLSRKSLMQVSATTHTLQQKLILRRVKQTSTVKLITTITLAAQSVIPRVLVVLTVKVMTVSISMICGWSCLSWRHSHAVCCVARYTRRGNWLPIVTHAITNTTRLA